jgi:hypothetical protein
VSPVRLVLIPLALLFMACPGYVPAEVEDRYLLGGHTVVDVLFVVDDSNTMGSVQDALGGAASDFLLPLNTRALDWQIAVVTTDMESAQRRGRITGPILSSAAGDGAPELALALDVGIDGSQYEAGLSAMWSAITLPLATHENAGLVREGSHLVIVVISDEDDCSDEGRFGLEGPESCVTRPHDLVPVTDYLERLLSVVPNRDEVIVHAVVEPGQTEDLDECGGSAPGTRYMELARATGGAVLPFCAPGAELMGALAAQVTGRRTAFPLSRTPDPASIDVRVGAPVAEGDTPIRTCGVDAAPGAVVPADPTRVNGWSYDAAANTLRLHGEAQPAIGDEVRICYEVS